jgi:hypothetical protein
MRKRRISSAERRHQDYLRKKGLAVGRIYEGKLLKARKAEVKRVLNLCREWNDPDSIETVINGQLDESGYYFDWQKGLFLNAGLPRAKSIVRDLSRAKAEDVPGVWESELTRYAERRAGENIVSVTGSLKKELVDITRGLMAEDTYGVEKLTQMIFEEYNTIAEWMVRRIAQTETMIGLAEAGDVAARSLDIGFTKTWAVSGLGNTRDSHLAMDGIEVDADDPFRLEDCLMMYPHDSSFGAPAGEIINCACDCIRRPK